MILGRKKKLKVDLRDMKEEQESFSSFLRSKLKVDVTSSGNKILVDSEDLSSNDLRKMVNKFVYHRNLMNQYWVALESGVVKIHKFKRSEKKKKPKKKGTLPSTVKHGW